MILIVLIIIFAVVALLLFEIFLKRKKLNGNDRLKVVDNWNRIQEKVENEPAQAIIEADKLLAFVLKKHGYVGSLGEMMRKARPLFTNNDGLWNAHKLRNKIAHEMEHKISVKQAMSALSSFKQALCDLGIQIRGDKYWA